MKKIKLIAAAIIAVVSICSFQASAQFRIGPRVGLNINQLHFNDQAFSSDNRAGFNLGVIAEFTVRS